MHPEFIRKKQARQEVDIEIWSTTFKEYIELAAQQIPFEMLIQNLEEYFTSADIQKLIYQLNLKNFRTSTLENVFKALSFKFLSIWEIDKGIWE